MSLTRVIAVTESAQLRETLSILLEYECRLRFLDSPDAAAAADMEAEIAFIAAPFSAQRLDPLLTVDPRIRVVALGSPESPPLLPAHYSGVETIALRPQEVRRAVHLGRRAQSGDGLRGAIEIVVKAVRAALDYPLTAWRMLPARLPATAAADILVTILREQTAVLDEICTQFSAFAERARHVPHQASFLRSLCEALPEAARRRHRNLPGSFTASGEPPAGPLRLAALLADLLCAHLCRRTAVGVEAVLSTRDLTLRYEPDRRSQGDLSLLLVAFALSQEGWELRRRNIGPQEQLSLAPRREATAEIQ